MKRVLLELISCSKLDRGGRGRRGKARLCEKPLVKRGQLPREYHETFVLSDGCDSNIRGKSFRYLEAI